MHMAENRGIDKVRGEGSPWRCLMNLNVRHGDCLAPAEYEHPHEIKKEYPPPRQYRKGPYIKDVRTEGGGGVQELLNFADIQY